MNHFFLQGDIGDIGMKGPRGGIGEKVKCDNIHLFIICFVSCFSPSFLPDEYIDDQALLIKAIHCFLFRVKRDRKERLELLVIPAHG